MIHELEYGRLLVVFDRKYSLAEFRKASQVIPGSYADELVERIYNCLLGNTTNIIAEYKKYYAIEYSSLLSFLYWKHQLDNKYLKKIEKRISEDIYIAFVKDSIRIFSDETVIEILNYVLSELGESITDSENNDYNLE